MTRKIIPEVNLCLILVVLFIGNFCAVNSGWSGNIDHGQTIEQSSREYSKLDVILVNRSENYLIFEDDEYLFNDETGVSSLNPDYTIQQVRELPVPCRVNLRYIKYSVTTELEPFPLGTKILKHIYFIDESRSGVGAISGRN